MSRGGIIGCGEGSSKQCNIPQYSDRVIVIAGSRLGVDAKTGLECWVPATATGEGAGGGWFRLALARTI
jgi:hypothetical protein